MTNHLHTVTITGADDAVSVERLNELSQAFPFVEWGILRSAKHSKPTERYPGWRWIEQLDKSRWHRYPLPEVTMRLSTHVCGRWARELMSGELRNTLEIRTAMSRRIQLNGWSQYRLPGLAMASSWSKTGGQRIIAQAASVTEFRRTLDFIDDHKYVDVDVLLDPSGGRGIAETDARHEELTGGSNCGYAGGIGPHNVREVLDQLGGRFGWIDMESGVRTGDKFDLDKVQAVLEQCRPYVSESH